MEDNEKILVKKDTLIKMQKKLNVLKVAVVDKEAKARVTELLEMLNNEIEAKNIPLDEMIKDRMHEIKYTNPDQYFKLYMLQRKIAQDEISEEEAVKAYDLYIHY